MILREGYFRKILVSRTRSPGVLRIYPRIFSKIKPRSPLYQSYLRHENTQSNVFLAIYHWHWSYSRKITAPIRQFFYGHLFPLFFRCVFRSILSCQICISFTGYPVRFLFFLFLSFSLLTSTTHIRFYQAFRATKRNIPRAFLYVFSILFPGHYLIKYTPKLLFFKIKIKMVREKERYPKFKYIYT